MRFSFTFVGTIYSLHREKLIYFYDEVLGVIISNRSSASRLLCKVYYNGTLIDEFSLFCGETKKILQNLNLLAISTPYDYCSYSITALFDYNITSPDTIPTVELLDKKYRTEIRLLDAWKEKLREETRKATEEKLRKEIEAEVRREWDMEKRRILKEQIRKELIKRGELTFDDIQKEIEEESVFD